MRNDGEFNVGVFFREGVLTWLLGGGTWFRVVWSGKRRVF